MFKLQSVRPAFNTEAYDRIDDNPFLAAAQDPLSTFSIDVDTASYANVRRFLTEGQLPPQGRRADRGAGQLLPLRLPAAARRRRPFSVTIEVAPCPWNAEHRLVRIGLKGRAIDGDKRCRRATSSS